MEDLPLDRIAALVPGFAVKDLPWAEHDDDILCIICSILTKWTESNSNNVVL